MRMIMDSQKFKDRLYSGADWARDMELNKQNDAAVRWQTEGNWANERARLGEVGATERAGMQVGLGDRQITSHEKIAADTTAQQKYNTDVTAGTHAKELEAGNPLRAAQTETLIKGMSPEFWKSRLEVAKYLDDLEKTRLARDRFDQEYGLGGAGMAKTSATVPQTRIDPVTGRSQTWR